MRSPRPTSRLRLGLCLWLLATAAAAVPLSPSTASRLHWGRPAGATPCAAGGPERARLAPFPGPRGPLRVAWQRRVVGGLVQQPLVDGSDRLLLLGSTRLTQMSAEGATLGEYDIAGAGALKGALLANGLRVIATAQGDILAQREDGSVAWRVRAPTHQGSQPVTLLPLWDGGALVTLGRGYVSLGADGAVRVSGTFSAPVVHTVQVGSYAYLLTRDGAVHRWLPFRGPKKVASLGGIPRSVVALDSRRMAALVSERGVVRLDTAAGTAVVIRRGGAEGFGLPLAADGQGAFLLGLSSGEVRRFGDDGEQRLASLPGRWPRQAVGARPNWLLFRDGAIAWWEPRGPLRLLTPGEAAREVAEVTCPQPLALSAGPKDGVIAACESGLVWFVAPGDPAVPDAAGFSTGRP